jgi:LicD family
MPVRRIRAIVAFASTIIGLACIARTLQTHWQHMRSSSKNSQYFKDVSFYSRTHLFGASNHVDSRFVPQTELSLAETRQALMDLMSSFSEFMSSIDARFWVAHGTLLGWYWNEQLLPWDTDVDVQVSDSTLQYLAEFYNMTFHLSASTPYRTYLLDINPFYSDTSATDRANTIDARWIDVENGKFIDIAAVHSLRDRIPSIDKLFCKDGHRYRVSLKIYVDLLKLTVLDHRHLPSGAGTASWSECNGPS